MNASGIPAPEFWGEGRGRAGVWPTPAQELLLEATLRNDERALEAWRQIRPQLDVAGMDGPMQALLPLLRRNLLALGVEDRLLALFKGVHRYSWARNQMLLAPMLPRVQALERGGIATLLLKGAAFVADDHAHAGLRPMNDVDVLVPSALLGEAIEILVREGLAPVGEVPTWYVAEYAPDFVPSHGFRDAEDRQLDLHWNVLHASRQPDADEDFWAAAVPVELLGVSTRALCAADELLLVVLHGLRWNAVPTYRWVVDAALIVSGRFGDVDYERLVRQARKRRVTVSLHAGLAYLQRVSGIRIPPACMRALRPLRPLALERVEHRAQLTQPRRRTLAEREILAHQAEVRRRPRLEERLTPRMHLRLAGERLGVGGWRDLGALRTGYKPGPGRPYSEFAAPVGRGVERVSSEPIVLDKPLEVGDSDFVRERTAYGMWQPERRGCWIAGREARLVLPVARPLETSLLLELSADGYLCEASPRQRVSVLLDELPLGEFSIGEQRPRLSSELILLPRAALAGRRTIELVLRALDATSPARLGLDDDDRSRGVYLRRLLLREPRRCAIGERLTFAADSGDQRMLVDGFGYAEKAGRWTEGARARILLRLVGKVPSSDLELLYEAPALLGDPAQGLTVEVFANGLRLETLAYDSMNTGQSPLHVSLPAAAVGDSGELLLEWRILSPRSPADLGLSLDARALGLFFRWIEVRCHVRRLEGLSQNASR
jgi:hypothetical protein